ncbi:MAG: 3'-5' exonuclease, partial [Pseudomonadota bacterium]
PAVRVRVNKRNGFPKDPEYATHKQAMEALLASLDDCPEFLRRLHELREFPESGFDEESWTTLDALCRVLLLCVAMLRVEFAAVGRVDHSEVTLSAHQALGDDDQPTDLALTLDHRVSHLLIDEFQDTSVSQFDLFEKLVRGWSPRDGRSLFLVGDPMQSIYRFRQAEVGLFLQARDSGVGGIPLESLYLTENFRSDKGVINSLNQYFACAFSGRENSESGAVAFTPSRGELEFPGAGVHIHPHDAQLDDAASTIHLIQQAKKQNPGGSIAILVRARAHLDSLFPLLEHHAIAYQAIKIETLIDRPVVRDLVVLTRALLHPADDVAWLALLRAPWCGLTLADLLVLTTPGADESSLVWRIMASDSLEQLSADGRSRLESVRTHLRPLVNHAGRCRWAPLVRAAWLALGGPAMELDLADLDAVKHFFAELDALNDTQPRPDPVELEQRLEKRPLPLSGTPRAAVSLMTIHNAKGLEFDTVIVPKLGRQPRRNDPVPIRWLQLPSGQCLLAMEKRPDEDAKERHPIFKLIQGVDREKDDNERSRLLYVAATRARSSLHLLGHAQETQSGLGPAAGSLLEVIWDSVAGIFDAHGQGDKTANDPTDNPLPDSSPPPLLRVPSGWRPSTLGSVVDIPGPASKASVSERPDVEFDWAGETARRVGVVVHHYLLQIANDGIDRWDVTRLASMRNALSLSLREAGVVADDVAQATDKSMVALSNTLQSERGQWILQDRAEAESELAISGLLNGELRNLIIDRTFVDPAGIRWIIDYKTGEHRGADRDAFLDSEMQRYQPQLESYAGLMAQLDSSEVRLGLYFPMLDGWREWRFDRSDAS